jgi:uncharacterized membrane protein
MILVVGLVVLIAAVVIAVTGVVTNAGHAHALTHGFAVLGYHVTGSTGELFLYGLVLGAIAMLALSLVLSSARRTSRRASTARVGLEQSRRETAAASKDRDNLIEERESARAYISSVPGGSAPPGEHRPDVDDSASQPVVAGTP